MFNCQKNTRLISDNMDRKLSRLQRLSIVLHGMMCSACRAYQRQVEAIDVLIKQHFQNPTASKPNDTDNTETDSVPHPTSLPSATRQKFNQLITAAIARKKNH